MEVTTTLSVFHYSWFHSQHHMHDASIPYQLNQFSFCGQGLWFFSMSLIQSGEMPFYVTLARFSSSKKKKKTFKHFCCCCCFIAMVVLMRMCYISSHSSRRIRKFVTGSQLWDFKCQNQAHSLALCLIPACRSVTPLVPCMSASHHDDGQRL